MHNFNEKYTESHATVNWKTLVNKLIELECAAAGSGDKNQ